MLLRTSNLHTAKFFLNMADLGFQSKNMYISTAKASDGEQIQKKDTNLFKTHHFKVNLENALIWLLPKVKSYLHLGVLQKH